MADEIQQAFEIPTRLIKGSRGAFEVQLDGETIFSKHEAGRFPEPGEISEQLAARLKA